MTPTPGFREGLEAAAKVADGFVVVPEELSFDDLQAIGAVGMEAYRQQEYWEAIIERIWTFALKRIAGATTALPTPDSFQPRVQPWMMECFGPEIAADKIERNHRFIEEALELVQANGCTKSEAHQLVDYVYDRDQGDINQEVGGVMVTLAALCLAIGVDMHAAGETELARVWTKIDKIRAKQAAKPRHSPLPAQPAGGGISGPFAQMARAALATPTGDGKETHEAISSENIDW